MIRTAIGPTTSSSGATIRTARRRSRAFLDRSAAAATTTANFAISDGWQREPDRSGSSAPTRRPTVPIAGWSTSDQQDRAMAASGTHSRRHVP